jgi:hypothetical protein
VNGQALITFTAIDEASETLYGIKKEKVIYDRNIETKNDAESVAESMLLSSKPTTTQTIKQATLEFYEFPVYRYNSATTTSVNRDIPRVLRAGDIIQVTINDGNYKFTNVPFLVQGFEYDDSKSLCKLSCTEGVFPTTTNMFNISNTTYEAAKEARDTARRVAAAAALAANDLTFNNQESGSEVAQVSTQTDVQTSSSTPAEDGLNVKVKVNPSIEASTENSVDEYRTTITLHPSQGAISVAGDTEDIILSGSGAYSNALITDTVGVAGSKLNLIVLSKTSPFVARDGGFSPPNNWTGRTVVLNAGATNETTYTITEVVSNASIRVSGEYEWTTNDAPVIRKISSAIKNPSLSDVGTTTYFDLDRREIRSRTGTQIISPSNTDSPVWGTNFVGFHGTKATNSSGIVVIDLYDDHGVGQLLTHKPIVIATVDPTDKSGDENTGAVQAAYVVVQKYTNWGDTPVLAQTGLAAAGSKGNILVAQAGDTSVSKFAAGLSFAVFPNASIGDTVFQIDPDTGKILKSGTVATVTNDYTLTTNVINGWVPGNRYVIHAQIRYIHLKVYYPSLQLDAFAAGATEHVLINTAGTQFYTSHATNRTVSTATAAVAGIGVHYMIIPKAHRKDHLPFDHDNGSGTFGHGNDF